MIFTSESGKGVLLPFVWAEYLDATTATPPHLSRHRLIATPSRRPCYSLCCCRSARAARTRTWRATWGCPPATAPRTSPSPSRRGWAGCTCPRWRPSTSSRRSCWGPAPASCCPPPPPRGCSRRTPPSSPPRTTARASRPCGLHPRWPNTQTPQQQGRSSLFPCQLSWLLLLINKSWSPSLNFWLKL